MDYHSLKIVSEVLVNTWTWLNLEKYMLAERTKLQRLHTEYSHQFEMFKRSNLQRKCLPKTGGGSG
jgi:hypothetical protein